MTVPRLLRPAAYMRVADAGSADDVLVQCQQQAVLSAAAREGV